MRILIFEKKFLEINLFNEWNFWWLPIWGEVHEIGWIQLWEFGIFIYFGVSKDRVPVFCFECPIWSGLRPGGATNDQKNQIYTILGVFHFFKKICWQNRLIWQKTDFENLKNRQTAKMAVFRRFLSGFWRFFNSLPTFSPFLPTKPANYENYG